MRSQASRHRTTLGRILIVDSDLQTQEILRDHLSRAGYEPVVIAHGPSAYSAACDEKFALVLTELTVPGMNGQDLIDRLLELPRPPGIVVISADDSRETLIRTIRKGVFDFALKPIQGEPLLAKLSRAVEASRLIGVQHDLELERRMRLENQLEWTLWKQNVVNRENNRLDRNLFQNLHTSFSQGAGFGLLLSLVRSLSEMSEARDDGYLVCHELMDMVKNGADYAERSLRIFEDIFHLISEDLPTEPVTLVDLHDLLRSTLEENKRFIGIKKQNILLCDCPHTFRDVQIRIHPEFLASAFTELLKNALKFSPVESQIVILIRKDHERAYLSFMNQTTPLPRATCHGATRGNEIIDGIPAEFERLVFEPFFRIVKTVDERYETIDNGLGLTRVQKIITRHNGSIAMFNVNDHIGAGLRVNAEVELPVLPAAG